MVHLPSQGPGVVPPLEKAAKSQGGLDMQMEQMCALRVDAAFLTDPPPLPLLESLSLSFFSYSTPPLSSRGASARC